MCCCCCCCYFVLLYSPSRLSPEGGGGRVETNDGGVDPHSTLRNSKDSRSFLVLTTQHFTFGNICVMLLPISETGRAILHPSMSIWPFFMPNLHAQELGKREDHDPQSDSCWERFREEFNRLICQRVYSQILHCNMPLVPTRNYISFLHLCFPVCLSVCCTNGQASGLYPLPCLSFCPIRPFFFLCSVSCCDLLFRSPPKPNGPNRQKEGKKRDQTKGPFICE